MSIILKGNNISSSNNDGIGPGEVKIIDTNIDVGSDGLNFMIMYSDPDDIIINNTTLSKWDRTILVVNTDHIPLSPKDGSILIDCKLKNYYSDAYSNMHLSKGMNYLRFFVYDKNKICNNSMNMAFTINTEYDSKLSNNTWEQIAKASEEGIASSLWKVGDEIDLTLSGAYKYNETVTLQIWDFNHFDKSDGSGKAGIVFGMKNLMKNTQVLTPNSSSNSGGWNDTTMKKTTMGQILNSMPSNLQNYIKEVNTYANQGGASSSSSIGKLSKDKVFLPGCTEVGFTFQSSTESGQKQFPIFTDNNSRIKKMNNGSGNAQWWWTRSPDSYYSTGFIVVGSDGHFNGYNSGSPDNSYGVCFCFCV